MLRLARQLQTVQARLDRNRRKDQPIFAGVRSHPTQLLLEMDVTIDVRSIRIIGKGVGELIVAVLAQIADMERQRIVKRCASGREAAKASLATTGRTHRGKVSLGRPKAANAHEVASWRPRGNRAAAWTSGCFGPT